MGVAGVNASKPAAGVAARRLRAAADPTAHPTRGLRHIGA